jgi:preprotein translocase subunit YajC
LLKFSLISFLFSFSFFVFFLVLSRMKKKKEENNTSLSPIGEGDAYALFPLLIWLEPEQYFIFFLLSVCLANPFAVKMYIKKQEVELALLPFLLASAFIIQSNWYIEYVVGISLFLSLLSYVWFLIFRIKQKREKK